MKASRLLVAASMLSVFLLGPVMALAQPASRPMRERMHERMAEHMKRMGMSKEMMLRARMIMRAEISRFSPNGLLALRDELKITDEQAEKLKKIEADAREKARAVLTPEQMAEVDKLPKTPVSGMGMHERMMQRMKQRGMDRDMKCPMMDMGTTTKPSRE